MAAHQEDEGQPRAEGIFLTQAAGEDLTGEEEETLLAAADAAAACRAGRAVLEQLRDLGDAGEGKGEGAPPTQEDGIGADPLDDGAAPEAAAPCAPSPLACHLGWGYARSIFAPESWPQNGPGSRLCTGCS